MDITQFLLSITHSLQNIIYPPRCLICDGVGARNRDLCEACGQALPWIKKACSQCALPLPDDVSENLICGRCLKKKPFFDDSVSVFSYEEEIVGLTHQLKFHDNLAVSRLFGSWLVDAVVPKMDKPDCLLPVPLHKRRLRQRGFNQSIEISRSLKKAWDIPVETKLVRRVRETQSQTGLDAKQRRRNIRGAFEVCSKINYNHVVIVDDVVTTGSTVNELARILKRHGVKKVSVFSIARAPIR